MTEAAPRPPTPAASGVPPWIIPASSGGLGLLVGLLLGFFMGSASGEGSVQQDADARVAKLEADCGTKVSAAEASRDKEIREREASQTLRTDLHIKVEVGLAIEFCLEAINHVRISNFGLGGQSLQKAREALQAAEAEAAPGVTKVQLTALDEAFDPVIVQILKLDSSAEKGIGGLVDSIRGARDKIAPELAPK